MHVILLILILWTADGQPHVKGIAEPDAATCQAEGDSFISAAREAAKEVGSTVTPPEHKIAGAGYQCVQVNEGVHA